MMLHRLSETVRALPRAYPALTLLLLGLLVLGAGLGLRDPWAPDEPRFVLIARDMLLSGDWFFPRVAGVLYPDKPPVFFWFLAFFYWLTGSLRWSFLLPSLLAAVGCVLLVLDLGTRLWSRRAGFAAGLLLLLTLQFGLQAREAQIDMLLCFWTTLGLYGLLRHLLLGPAWGWYTLGFAAMGLGVITKGVGFLPLLVFLPWALARWRGALPPAAPGPDWRWLWGPLALLGTIGLWLLPLLWLVATKNDPALTAYRDNILFHQTGERYADAWHHLKPWWYYLVEVIPLFWLPATAALPWLVPAWYRRVRRGDGRYWLLLGWIALVVVFFSLSPGKRGVYMLPAVPALALACGALFPALMRRRGIQRLGFSITGLFALLWLAVLAYYLLLRPERAATLVERYEVSPWLFVAGLGLAALFWLLPGPRRGAWGLAGYIATLWLLYGFWGYPLLNPARSPADMMHTVNRQIGPDAQLGLVDWKEQLVLFADRPVTHFGFRRGGAPDEVEDGLRWLVTGTDRYLLLPGHAVQHHCIVISQAENVDFEHREFWWLVDATDIKPGCTARLRGLGPPETRREALYRDRMKEQLQ